MNSFDRRIWILLAGLAGLLLLIVAAGSLVGLPAPALVPESGLVSPRGPLELAFSQAVRAESLNDRLRVINAQGEALPGRLDVSGAQVRFWPDQAFLSDQTYTLRLEAGVQGQSGLLLRDARSWPVRARPVEVIYMTSTGAPDLWAVLLGDGNGNTPAARQLTFTEGRVYDYDVSPDGNQIIYAVYNEQGGIDLWRIGRAGGVPEVLLPCQADLCFNPAIAPDGQQLAYSRRQAGANNSQPAGLPHLWLLTLANLSTNVLTPDPNVAGFQPVWSPDSRYLAFGDASNGAAYVYDRQSEDLFSQPASLNGPLRWFPDSRRLFVSIIEGGGSDARPFVQVFALHVDTQAMELVLGADLHQKDYSIPEWSPDGEWLAVALRRVDSGPGKGLWKMRLDGSQSEVISPGEIYTNGAYSWDPHSRQLVFQRLELGSSRSLPQIMVWSMHQPEPVLIAEDAVLPRWLP